MFSQIPLQSIAKWDEAKHPRHPKGTPEGGEFADQTITPEAFIAARDKSTRKGFLSPLTPEDLKGYKLYLSHDGKVGGAMSPKGDMGNLFNNGGPKGAAHEILLEMIADGGKTADAYDGYLPELYANFGLFESGRMKFNPEYAPPGWNFEKDDSPDVIFLALTGKVGRADADKTKWVPIVPTTNYYDDYELAQRDALARAESSRTGSVVPLRTHAGPGVDGETRKLGLDGSADDRRRLKGEYKYGNTQVSIDPWSAAAQSLNTARGFIRDEDLAGNGKDVDPNHITVRYGLLNDDLDGLRAFIAAQHSFPAQVTGIELFPASEHSDGAVPVVARIFSPDLHAVEAEIGKYADFKDKSFPVYKPHCTLAYCKPEASLLYAEMPVGGTFLVHNITISHASGVMETIPFGMAQKRQWDERKHPRLHSGAHGGEFTETLHGAKDALDSLLAGEHDVSIDRNDVRRFLELAAEQPEDPDLTDLQVEGMMIFGGNGLGIPREEMPQIPREHREQFLKEVEDAGFQIVEEEVDPLTLKPTQRDVSARDVALKLEKYEKGGKAFPPLLVAKNGRILDGHHHWGMMAAVAIDVPEIKVPVFRIKAPTMKLLAMMHDYDRRHHIERKKLGQKWDAARHPRDQEGQFTQTGTVTVGDREITVVKPKRARKDTLVPLDVEKFDQRFRGDTSFYLSEGGGPNAISNRYAQFGKFIAENDSIESPEVYIGDDGRVGFTNGRHRYAWLRDHGIKTIPVAMDEESVRNAKKHGYLSAQKYDPNEPRDEKGRWTKEGQPTTFYHGTVQEQVDSIKEHGLKTDYSGLAWPGLSQPGTIYLARTKHDAMVWAESSAIRLNWKYENPVAVVLEIRVPAEVLAKSQRTTGITHTGEPEGNLRVFQDIPPEWIRSVTVGRSYDAAQGRPDRPPRTLPARVIPPFIPSHKQEDTTFYVGLVVEGERVKKADPKSGRYVTPFVSFDKQGDDQLRMIASLNSSRLATWGFTAEAEVRGLARYRLTAVLDGRTSKFCRMINGKVFDVTDAREKVIEALNVQDPNDLRVVQPWPKQTREAMAQFATMGADELVARGLHIPPYHPYCRTLLRPVTSSAGELGPEDVTPTIPAGAETFQPVTLADLKELGVEATQEQLDLWNAHVGMSPVELLSKLSGVSPQEVMTDGVGANPIQFSDAGIAMRARGEVSGVEFKLGALLDPFTGIYYLSYADLMAGTPKAEAKFLRRMFSALIDMGKASPTAEALAVGVAGNAAYYAKMGFLPDEIEWDAIRQYALDALDTTLQPMMASLAPADQELVRHLLQDRSVSALSALTDLPFMYEGKTIGEHILSTISGTWALDLTDEAMLSQAEAYLS